MQHVSNKNWNPAVNQPADTEAFVKKHAFLILILTFLTAFSVCFADDTGDGICFDYFMENAVNGIPKILYTGITKSSLAMRSKPDRKSDPIGSLNERTIVNIFGFDQTWLYCWDENVGVY